MHHSTTFLLVSILSPHIHCGVAIEWDKRFPIPQHPPSIPWWNFAFLILLANFKVLTSELWYGYGLVCLLFVLEKRSCYFSLCSSLLRFSWLFRDIDSCNDQDLQLKISTFYWESCIFIESKSLLIFFQTKFHIIFFLLFLPVVVFVVYMFYYYVFFAISDCGLDIPTASAASQTDGNGIGIHYHRTYSCDEMTYITSTVYCQPNGQWSTLNLTCKKGKFTLIIIHIYSRVWL